MHESLAKFWIYTSIVATVIIGTTNLNVSFAGGDPSIKDNKVYQTKSNIIQKFQRKLKNLQFQGFQQ